MFSPPEGVLDETTNLEFQMEGYGAKYIEVEVFWVANTE